MKFLLALLLVGVAHSAWAKSVETKGKLKHLNEK